MWRSNYALLFLRILWRLHLASAITLYAVLAGHGADLGEGISWGCAMWFIYWGRQEWCWQVSLLL